MAEALELRVRETDAFTLSVERDPLLRSTIVAVAFFDRAPRWDELVQRVDRATRLEPTFRERLLPTPLGLAPPRWIVDRDFDLSWHLRRVEAPSPKDEGTVLDLARIAGMTAFDPARPLWEFTLVEGLDGGRAAMVMKVHHALTDGIGGIQIAAHVVDLTRESGDLGPMPPAPEPRSHSTGGEVRDALVYDLRRGLELLLARTIALPRDLRSILGDPLGVARETLATAGSLARFVQPVTTTLSPLMQDRRLRWHYDTLDVPLDGLRTAGRRVDGTVNDGFIGGVTGGLRRYHERHGVPVGDLRLTMPVSMRTEDDPEGGNRITLVRFTVPVGIEDPVERMRAIDEICSSLRRDRALPYSNAVAGALNLLPAAITGGMLKHVDFLASNVPGFTDPVYVGGALVESFHAFGPTLGSAANITLMSYRGTGHIGVNTDAGAVPDPLVLRECLLEGMDEVVSVERAAP